MKLFIAPLKPGKRTTYTGTSPPLFSKKAMQWGKKWPVQMNLPFFAVEAYVPGGGPEPGRKKFEKKPSGRYRYKNLLFQQTIYHRPRNLYIFREWPRYCRKVYWAKMAQNGPNDHFGQNDFIPNRILAFAEPKWTKMVHFGLKRSILVHLGPPTVLWPFLNIMLPQNISRYGVGELYLMNSPQNFSRHAPVTEKKAIHSSGISKQPSGKFGLQRYTCEAAEEFCSDSLKGFHNKPTPPDTWPGFAC